MRSDELLVAAAVEKYLGLRLPGQQVSVGPGADPPDFILHVGSEAFPLEVTSTEVWHEPSVGQGQVRELTFYTSHRNLIKSVERVAIQSDAIHGRYAIAFKAPLSAEDYKRRKAQFERRMLQLLAASKSEPEGFESEVEVEGKLVAWVYKLADEGMRMYEVFEDGAWTESPEFIALVTAILSKALRSKCHKLEGSSLVSRSILAIRNTYGLADQAALLQAAEGLKVEMAQFHSVFVVNERRVLPLHSREPGWIAGDT